MGTPHPKFPGILARCVSLLQQQRHNYICMLMFALRFGLCLQIYCTEVSIPMCRSLRRLPFVTGVAQTGSIEPSHLRHANPSFPLQYDAIR